MNALHPDLVFLDINLKDGSGFDLIHSLNEIGFKIIFISACDKGMIQAFRLSGFEFLLKPINPVELKAAVKGVEETDQQDLILQLKALEANVLS
jgi:two-component system LytT family response regulator